ADARIQVAPSWTGSFCRSTIVNRSRSPARVKEIVLFDVAHAWPDTTRLYGEGFQMLSQTGGTLGNPVDLGNYTDATHYRMPQPADATVAYGMVTLSTGDARLKPRATLLAFTSCRRFVGRFDLSPWSLKVVLDAESQTLAPGQRWDLEELMIDE